MREAYRFTFKESIANQQIEQRLLLAALNTETIFGEAAMRLDASFRFDKASRTCLIDSGTEVGRHIAKLFIAYISKEFGDECYSLERIENEPATTTLGRSASDATEGKKIPS